MQNKRFFLFSWLGGLAWWPLCYLYLTEYIISKAIMLYVCGWLFCYFAFYVGCTLYELHDLNDNDGPRPSCVLWTAFVFFVVFSAVNLLIGAYYFNDDVWDTTKNMTA